MPDRRPVKKAAAKKAAPKKASPKKAAPRKTAAAKKRAPARVATPVAETVELPAVEEAPPAGDILLEVRDLTSGYGALPVLHGVSFSVSTSLYSLSANVFRSAGVR